MLWRFVFLLGMAIGLAVQSGLMAQSDGQAAVNEHAAKAKELLKERREVLATRVEILEHLFQIARTPYMDVINAKDDLRNAELELSDSRDRRLEVLRSQVENLQQGEEYMKGMKRDAKANEADVLTLTARRLKAQIELERTLAGSGQ